MGLVLVGGNCMCMSVRSRMSTLGQAKDRSRPFPEMSLGVGVAAVSPDRAHLVDVLDSVERLVAYRPEVELLSVRRTLRSAED